MSDLDLRDLEAVEGQTQILIAAVNASISGVIITDFTKPDNPIVFCNRAFEDMTGYNHSEILGKNCRFLQASDREQIGRYILQDAVSKQEPCNVEIANYRKDGTIFYNELYIAPIKNSTGVVTHFVGIQNDITQRRLKEVSVQLELANKRKLQQQKDNFTSMASHELKTPVTSLKATLQMINRIINEKPSTDERLRELSRNAERHANKLVYLMNGLLDTTRMSQGEVPLKKIKFSVAQLVESCCSHFAFSGTHHIKSVGRHDIDIMGDQHQLDQVMINLVDNAVRFSPIATEILIEVEKVERWVKISVIDKGKGIAKDELPHIFERYFKGEKDHLHTPGLGLGLYIASEIIKRHGGDIAAESTPGEGTRLWFTMPAADS
jgi:PAS domain S-box-containing protein